MSNLPLERPTCQQDWEDQYWHIRQAWWDQDLTLKDVMEKMKKEYGFDATSKQYKTMLDNWGLGKNVKTEEMKAIVKIQARRQPKETTFYVRNRPVPQDKIDRFLKRTYGVTRPSPSVFSPFESTPWQVWYCTPVRSGLSGDRDAIPVQAQPPETDIETETWFEDFITLPSSNSPIHGLGVNLNPSLIHPSFDPQIAENSMTLPNSNPPTRALGVSPSTTQFGFDTTRQPNPSHAADTNQPLEDAGAWLSISMDDQCWGLVDSFKWAIANDMNDLANSILSHSIQLPFGLLTGLLAEVVSLIHIAIIQRDVEAVQYLLDHGADPEARTSSGYVAMHFAALFGDVAIVDILLNKGANPRAARSRLDLSTMCLDSFFEPDLMLNTHMTPLMVELTSKETPLMVAVTHRQSVEFIQFLLDRGVNAVDVRWKPGWTCDLRNAQPSMCRCVECQLKRQLKWQENEWLNHSLGLPCAMKSMKWRTEGHPGLVDICSGEEEPFVIDKTAAEVWEARKPTASA